MSELEELKAKCLLLERELQEAKKRNEELEAYKDRLRFECVSALTDAGACMLADTDPCAPGEVPRAVREIVRAAESRAQEAETRLRSALKARDEAADQVLVLREALEELIEVADLRGDSDLPHPSDDPKLWTARMIDAWDGGRDALSNTSDLAAQRKREIQRDAWGRVEQTAPTHDGDLDWELARSAILGTTESNPKENHNA